MSLSRPLSRFTERLPRFLYSDITFRDGETARTTLPANRTQGGRAVGGRLTVTDQRLAFTPHRLEIRADRWSCEVSDVRRVWVEPKRQRAAGFIGKARAIDGSTVDRFAVETSKGRDFFVVGDPAAVASLVRSDNTNA